MIGVSPESATSSGGSLPVGVIDECGGEQLRRIELAERKVAEP